MTVFSPAIICRASASRACGLDRGGAAAAVQAQGRPQDQACGVDFHMLAPSWRPACCAAEGETTGACRSGGARSRLRADPRDVGHHRRLRAGVARMKDPRPLFGPERGGLFRAEPRGMISHRPPEDFRAGAKRLRAEPELIESAFLQADRDLTGAGVPAICRKGRTNEIRICMEKDRTFTECSPGVRQECSRPATLETLC
jgi:ribonuclease I